MKCNLKLFCCLFLIISLSGCATLSPSGQDMLRNQQPESEYNYSNEVKNLSSLYPSLGIEEIQVLQNDGNISKGIHVKKENAEYTILYFGPNNYPILKQNNNVIPYLTQLNANIIWFDYRGFGFTSGVASFDVLKRDAAHIYESVRHKVKRPLVLHGLSIGSILAIDVASNYDVENLVLEGSITTVKDWVNYSFVAQAYYSHGIPKLIGYLIKPLFNVEPSKEIAAIDNHKALLTHKGRLLMLTGENDWETPPEINKKLFDSIEAGRSSYFHVIENVGHLDTLTSENAIDIYRTFLSN